MNRADTTRSTEEKLRLVMGDAEDQAHDLRLGLHALRALARSGPWEEARKTDLMRQAMLWVADRLASDAETLTDLFDRPELAEAPDGPHRQAARARAAQ